MTAGKEAKAKAFIMLYVADYYLPTLQALSTGKEVWDKLKELYRAQTVARHLQLRQELVQLRMTGAESITMFISRARRIWTDLNTCGDTMDEAQIVLAVLAGLPKSYGVISRIIQSSDNVASLSVDTVLQKLLPVEQELASTGEKSMALMAQARKGPGQPLSKRKCFNCGEFGHIAVNCPGMSAIAL